jgi:hypothetical protein
MRISSFLLLTAGVALALPATLPAQPSRAPVLTLGRAVQGTLAESDPAILGRGAFRVYQLRAEPGRRYVATMDAEDFDAYLVLARTVGGLTDYMREDDDGGEGTNSRLRFTVPTRGTYYIVAQALSANSAGAFTVRVDTLVQRPPVIRDLSLGTPLAGTLSETDPEYEEEDSPEMGAVAVYQIFRFQGQAGQRIRARVETEEFYPRVEIGMMDGGAFIPVEEESEAEGAFSMVTLPSAGTYYVRAGGYGEGEFTVAIEERRPTPVTGTPLRRGSDVAGELGSGDADLDDGRWVDIHTFTATAGESVTITLRSDDFDTYLILGRVSGGRFEELDRNDDAGGEEGLNSRIEFVAPAGGEYQIRATAFSSGAGGRYVLRVQP